MKIIKHSLQELFRDNTVVFIQSKTLEASGSNPSVAIYLLQLVQLPRPILCNVVVAQGPIS